MEKLVIDASVAIDLFAGREELRIVSAEKVFECVTKQGIGVYAPRLFLTEVAGVLVRFLSPNIVRGIVERLRDEVTLVGDDLYFTEAVEIALTTGSRGTDSYYIGLAKTLNAPLVTSDKVQALNAKKSKIRSFFILNKHDLENLLDILKCKKII
ncbi:MAG: type II toxin-antitoxin system VapC family toxin [Desulfurococcales archaeon]|nr:type II toxin-antitoxin system VapC family toxin [Desulfurococcales archaeon]